MCLGKVQLYTCIHFLGRLINHVCKELGNVIGITYVVFCLTQICCCVVVTVYGEASRKGDVVETKYTGIVYTDTCHVVNV